MKTVRVELNPKFILYLVLFLAVLLAAWEIRGVIAMFFIAFIMNAGLRPPVDALERRGIPRMFSIFLIFLGFIGILVFVFVVLASEFINQIGLLFGQLPEIFSKFVEFVELNIPILNTLLPLQTLEQELGEFVATALGSNFFNELVTGENLLSVVQSSFGIFGSAAGLLLSIFTVMMVTFYMLQRKSGVFDGIVELLPDELEDPINRLLVKIQNSLGAWLPGQVLLMVIIGVFTYIIVWLPGLFDPNYVLDDFALPIALLAGFFEVIPSVGPISTLILSSLLALGTSGIGTVVYVIVSFTALQSLEATFIVPLVMKRVIGIDPILIILGFIAAIQLGGIVGAILVVPVLAVVQIVLVEISKEYKRQQKRRPKLL